MRSAALSLVGGAILVPVQDPPRRVTGRFYILGALTLACFVGAFCLGCTELANAEYVWSVVAFALFVVFLVLFVPAEKKA